MHSLLPTVSIVLPVFNGERFLRDAVESVLKQTSSNWELLIINDGSTDSTASICDEFAATDKRIRVFHQANGGVNAARAKGIDNATGDYLTFLDADDALLPNALDQMIGLFCEDIDLVAYGRVEGRFSREEYIKALWKGETGLVLWGKMFRTSLFKPIAHSLDRRMVMGEDLLLNSIYALAINSAYIFPLAVYDANRDNEASVTRNFKHNWEYEKYFFSKVDELFLNKCIGWDSYEEIRLLVNKSWLNAMKYVLLDSNNINYQDVEFKSVKSYFLLHRKEIGPSERLIFIIRNSYLYRIIIKLSLKMRGLRNSL